MYFEVNKLKMDQGSGQALKKLSKHQLIKYPGVIFCSEDFPKINFGPFRLLAFSGLIIFSFKKPGWDDLRLFFWKTLKNCPRTFFLV